MKNTSGAKTAAGEKEHTSGLYSFHTVNEWRTALTALPDQNFFELLRSIFGNIKTPFNKQKLMDELYALLSKEDIRRTIAAYIDEKDHLVIAAVALLNSPALGELENFFSVDMPFGEMHSLIRNLEERLILFRFEDGEERRMALNPVLESILLPLTQDLEKVFPSIPYKPGAAKPEPQGKKVFTPDNRIIAGLFNYIESEKNFFKMDGMRKKIHEDGKRFFPDMDMELIIKVIERLGLFNRKEEMFIPDKKRIQDFSILSFRERQEYWAAALYLILNESFNNVKSVSAWESYSNSRLKETAFFVHSLMNLLNPLKKYPKTTLRRYSCLLAKDYSGKESWGRHLFGDSPEFRLDPFLETLVKCDLISMEDDYISVACLGEPVRPKGAKENAVAAMDSPISFVLYPDISLYDALELASFASLNEEGGYTITRASAIRFFDLGHDSKDILELLKQLSGGRVDSSLEYTLKDWETRYTSVSLYQGIVLSLAEDRRYLAEIKPLSNMIKKKLAPGVYLLSPKDRNDITRALMKAGVDIFSQPDPDNNENKILRIFGTFPSPERNYILPPVFGLIAGQSANAESNPARPKENKTENSAAEMKKHFVEKLEKMKIPDTEREELNARIERRLVLTENQLETSSLKYEKLEVRGLDYNGKSVLARQAIASGSILEVCWTESGGEQKTLSGFPSALDKKNGDLILVMRTLKTASGIASGESDQENKAEVLNIPLRKISRLRRIKQSIFE